MKNTTLFLTLIILTQFCLGQTENYWIKKNDFPGFKRERAVAFSIDDYGYIGTGVDTAENVLKDLWQYDPILDSWSQKADLPGSARRDAVGFALAGKGYIGTGIDNDESLSGVKLNDLWEYDPLLNNWTQKANFPGSGGAGVYFATAFTVDSKGYICCGKVGANSYTNQLWEYKPSTNQWSQRANFPGGVRYQLSSFTIGYNGYVGLGANQDVFKKDFWKYSPGTNTWEQIADLPASERGSACTFNLGERGFVCLGSNGGLLNDLWEYNPTLNEWAVRATYGGSERKNAVAFAINNHAYVGTGKGYSGKKGSMHEYIPFNSALSVDEELLSFSVYPNPATELVNLSWQQDVIHQITMVELSGKVCASTLKTGSNTAQLNVSGFQPGNYFLVAQDESGNILTTQPIIVR